MGMEWRARDARGRGGRVSQRVDRKWIQFRHGDGRAGEEVILSALASPGRNGRGCWLKSSLWRNVKPGNQTGAKSIMGLLVNSASKLIISV